MQICKVSQILAHLTCTNLFWIQNVLLYICLSIKALQKSHCYPKQINKWITFFFSLCYLTKYRAKNKKEKKALAEWKWILGNIATQFCLQSLLVFLASQEDPVFLVVPKTAEITEKNFYSIAFEFTIKLNWPEVWKDKLMASPRNAGESLVFAYEQGVKNKTQALCIPFLCYRQTDVTYSK